MILPRGQDCRIKWQTLNMGAYRDKEIGWLRYGIGRSTELATLPRTLRPRSPRRVRKSLGRGGMWLILRKNGDSP